MELIYREMPDDYTLIASSCVHMGAFNHYDEGLERLVEKVATKKNYFLANLGDNIEAKLPHDKHFSGETLSILAPLDQANAFIDKIKPIAKKIIAIGYGNHEAKLINHGNLGKHIADTLGVRFGSVHYKFCSLDKKGQLMHKMYFHHGSGSLPKGAKDPIQRKANIQAAIRRKLEGTGHADCVVMGFGHTHHLDIVNPTTTGQLYLTDNGSTVKQHYNVMSAQNQEYIPPDSRWYLNCGSLRKSITPSGLGIADYAEIAMYGPTELGWTEIRVEGGKVVGCEKIVV
jgi:hypothetical protein